MAAGRPTAYKDEYVGQAEKLCLLGATDAEMAEFFDVDVRTLQRWKLDHPEFCHSIKVGKDNADNRVELSLYQKATGYAYTEQQAFKIRDGDKEKLETIEVEKFAPPDTSAMIFWLKNRKKDQWRDKVDVDAKVTGSIVLTLSPVDERI